MLDTKTLKKSLVRRLKNPGSMSHDNAVTVGDTFEDAVAKGRNPESLYVEIINDLGNEFGSVALEELKCILEKEAKLKADGEKMRKEIKEHAAVASSISNFLEHELGRMNQNKIADVPYEPHKQAVTDEEYERNLKKKNNLPNGLEYSLDNMPIVNKSRTTIIDERGKRYDFYESKASIGKTKSVKMVLEVKS